MGNDQAKPNSLSNKTESQQTAQNKINTGQNSILILEDGQQYFLLQEINKIKLNSGQNDSTWYWIDPRIYNDQNGKNLKGFKQNLVIEQFSSLTSLQNQLAQLDNFSVIKIIAAASLPDQNYKWMNQQKKVSEVILFCQNQQRAKLLMSNFPKISGVGFTCNEVLQLIKKSPSKSIKSSVLYMIQDDTSLMNKYRLNYYCLTIPKNKNNAKKQFTSLAKKLFPQQNDLIVEFTQNYSLDSTGAQRKKQVLEWIFKNSFYWDLVEKLPRMTTDPRRLAYLRTPIKDMYETIKEGYKQIKKKAAELFIIIEISQDQKEKLGGNLDNFLIFTTFIKGFSDEGLANKEFKRLGSNAFKFTVVQAKRLNEELDFGYLQRQGKIQNQPDIVFNIYNFFKVTDLSINARNGTLQYGSLAQVFKLRQDPNARKKLNQNQKNLLRNYDYLQDLMKKIKNQGSILQLSGYYKQSIKIYDKKLQEITRTNKPAAMLDQYRIQKGDALKMSQQYDLAQNNYNEVQTQKLKLVAKIRLIQLYFIRRNQAKVDQMIELLESQIQKLKQWGFTEDYFRGKNYMGLNLMKKQKFKEAYKHFKQLRQDMSDFYDYKLEGLPLAHQVYRNLGLCSTKINNHEQALNFLNSTKAWQQSSEGRGPTLLLTQRMIQNVYQSKGDKDGVQQTEQKIKRMIDQSAVNINFIDASKGAVKIQQSIQQSLVTINLDSSSSFQTNKKNTNIEQSAVNIDI